MSRNSLDALFGMMNTAFLEKEKQENEKVLKALDGFGSVGHMTKHRTLRLRTHTNFGVEYDVPLTWEEVDAKMHDSVMYIAKGFDGHSEYMSAALQIYRRRGDYRGYENVDQLKKMASYASKESGAYDLKYLEEVNIGGRKGVKAVCEDIVDSGEAYDTDIYIFYKSKTELMQFFCVTARRARPYYGRIFNKILSSIRYIR